MGDIICGADSEIRSNNVTTGNNVVLGNDVLIDCPTVIIGDNVEIQSGARITCLDKLVIGEESIVGADAKWSARSIEIGRMFYSNKQPTPMVIGGGSWRNGRVKFGDGCVIHDSFINCAADVTLGNNVGLSPGSAILTHGFWNPIIDGYWKQLGEVKIGSNSFIGFRAIIMPNVTIGEYVTVGAGSVVTEWVKNHNVVAGNPAIIIGIRPRVITNSMRITLLEAISRKYIGSLIERNLPPNVYNNIRVYYDGDRLTLQKPSGDFTINLKDYSWSGVEDEISDDFRDYLRRFGIRILSRKFRSLSYKGE